jgi:hypothetical protein
MNEQWIASNRRMRLCSGPELSGAVEGIPCLPEDLGHAEQRLHAFASSISSSDRRPSPRLPSFRSGVHDRNHDRQTSTISGEAASTQKGEFEEAEAEGPRGDAALALHQDAGDDLGEAHQKNNVLSTQP